MTNIKLYVSSVNQIVKEPPYNMIMFELKDLFKKFSKFCEIFKI